MKKELLTPAILILTITLGPLCLPAAEEPDPIRLGLIGLDTSHVIAFTRVLNDPTNPDHVPGCRVVAGFKGGSPDVQASSTRVDKFTEQLREEFGLRIVPTIPELCGQVDGILPGVGRKVVETEALAALRIAKFDADAARFGHGVPGQRGDRTSVDESTWKTAVAVHGRRTQGL